MGILDEERRYLAQLDEREAKARAAGSDSSMRAMLAGERRPIEWVVPDLLPVGLGLIVGKPKAGKSFLGLDLAVSTWLGEYPMGQPGELPPADVLYINLEETEELVMERLDGMHVIGGPRGGADCDITWRWRSQMSEYGPIADLAEWLSTHPKARLVLIDTWVKFAQFGAESRGLNAYERDVKMLEPIQQLARQYNVAIVSTFHQKKTSRWDSDDPFESISGSMGTIGSADCIWHLNRPHREEPEATLTVGGRMIRGERSYAIYFDSQTVTWLMRGEQDTVVTSEMREVLEVLSGAVEEGLTLLQIYAEVRCERDALRKRLQRMRAKGLIRPEGKTPKVKWQITGTGELYIASPMAIQNERQTRGVSRVFHGPFEQGQGGVSPMSLYGRTETPPPCPY